MMGMNPSSHTAETVNSTSSEIYTVCPGFRFLYDAFSLSLMVTGTSSPASSRVSLISLCPQIQVWVFSSKTWFNFIFPSFLARQYLQAPA